MKLFPFCVAILLSGPTECMKMSSFFSEFFHFKNVKSIWTVLCSRNHEQMVMEWRKDTAAVISLQWKLDQKAVRYDSRETIGLIIDVSCELSDFARKFLNDEDRTSPLVVLLLSENDVEEWEGILPPTFSNCLVASFLAVPHAQNGTEQVFLYDERLDLTMSWAPEGGLKVLKPSQRSSLSGQTIRGMITLKNVDHLKPDQLVDSLEEKSCTVTDNLMKFSFALHQFLEKMYDFRWQLTLAEPQAVDQIYGSANGSLTYFTNGSQFGALRDGRVDVGLYPAEYLPDGLDLADFLPPLTTFRQYFVFSNPVTSLEPYVVYSQFSGSVWGVAVCLALLASLISELSTKLTAHNEVESIELNLNTNVLIAIGALAQQGLERTSEKLSVRIAHFFLLLLTSMLFMFYNTGLLMYTLEPSQKAINSIEELLRKGFSLSAENTPYNKHQLEGNYSHQNEWFYQNCRSGWGSCKTDVEFLNLSAGVDRLKHEKTAFFGYSSNIYGFATNVTSDREQNDLREVVVHKPFLIGTFVRKRFKHKELLARGLLLLREAGIVHHEDRKWIYRKPDPLIDSYFVIASLYSTSVAFIVLFAGIAVAMLLFLLEILTKHEHLTAKLRGSMKRAASRLGRSVSKQIIILK